MQVARENRNCCVIVERTALNYRSRIITRGEILNFQVNGQKKIPESESANENKNDVRTERRFL